MPYAAISNQNMDAIMCTALEKRLQSDNSDWRTASVLADMYRRQGRLENAAALYQQVHAQNPACPLASNMTHLFDQRPLFRSKHQKHPAPFVLVQDFLPEPDLDSLFTYAQSEKEHFAPAAMGRQEAVHKNLRAGLVLCLQGQLRKVIKRRVRDMLPGIAPVFGYSDFDIGVVEMQISNYLNKDFFAVHYDNYPGMEHRLLNMVLFIHHSPASFSGGDLCIYDHDPANFEPTVTKKTFHQFTRFLPKRNSAVFFLPDYYHEVSPVKLHDNNFASGRMAVVAHFGRKRK